MEFSRKLGFIISISVGLDFTRGLCQLLGSMYLIVPITVGVVLRVRVYVFACFTVGDSCEPDDVSDLNQVPDCKTVSM